MRWTYVLVALPVAAAAGMLAGWSGRQAQERAVDALWAELSAAGAGEVERFDPAMTDGLPLPARRYLLRSIAPGTPLARAALVTMHGGMRLQPGGDLLAARAEQVLAPPRGLVWRAKVGTGAIRFQGFDLYDVGRERGAMRWWLYGLVPLVRAEGPDVTRSAAGRLGGETLWLPSMLLPGRGVTWEPVDDSTAIFRITLGGEEVVTTVIVAEDGRLVSATMRRWREGADDRPAGYARFVVDEWDEERTFGGYTIPTRFRAGWELGTPDGFPFLYGQLDRVEFR
jgi:hypothetical protein